MGIGRKGGQKLAKKGGGEPGEKRGAGTGEKGVGNQERNGVGIGRKRDRNRREGGGNHEKRDRIHMRRQEPWEEDQNQREAGRNREERGWNAGKNGICGRVRSEKNEKQFWKPALHCATEKNPQKKELLREGRERGSGNGMSSPLPSYLQKRGNSWEYIQGSKGNSEWKLRCSVPILPPRRIQTCDILLSNSTC